MRKTLFYLLAVFIILNTQAFAYDYKDYFGEFNFDSVERLTSLDTKSVHYLVIKDNKVGVYSHEKKEIVPVIYDDLLYRSKEGKTAYYYLMKDGRIYVLTSLGKKVAKIYAPQENISQLSRYSRYLKIENNSKYAWYDPKNNKQSQEFYDDLKLVQGETLVFRRDVPYLQYKKYGTYHNADKTVLLKKIIYAPVEYPVAAIHDAGECILCVFTLGLWNIFMGTDWWLTGGGSQGLP